MNVWFDKLHETFIERGYWRLIVSGFANTIKITAGALIIGVLIGFLVALGKYYSQNDKRLKIFSRLFDLYVTVIRGIPVVVLLLIFYFVIFPSSQGIFVAILTFGVNSGAYMTELIRSGINAVDTGQFEASYSLGLNRNQTMINIIIPQAVRNILPGIGNEFIALLKETSVAGYVAVVDLTRAGNMVRNSTFDAFNPLLIVALTYLFLVVFLSLILSRVEKRLSSGKRKISA